MTVKKGVSRFQHDLSAVRRKRPLRRVAKQDIREFVRRSRQPGQISCLSWVASFIVARASCPCFLATGKMPVLRELEN